jgi:predicted amidohydrolase
MAEIPAFEEGVIVCEIPIEELGSYRDARPILRDSKK